MNKSCVLIKHLCKCQSKQYFLHWLWTNFVRSLCAHDCVHTAATQRNGTIILFGFKIIWQNLVINCIWIMWECKLRLSLVLELDLVVVGRIRWKSTVDSRYHLFGCCIEPRPLSHFVKASFRLATISNSHFVHSALFAEPSTIHYCRLFMFVWVYSVHCSSSTWLQFYRFISLRCVLLRLRNQSVKEK